MKIGKELLDIPYFHCHSHIFIGVVDERHFIRVDDNSDSVRLYIGYSYEEASSWAVTSGFETLCGLFLSIEDRIDCGQEWHKILMGSRERAALDCRFPKRAMPTSYWKNENLKLENYVLALRRNKKIELLCE